VPHRHFPSKGFLLAGLFLAGLAASFPAFSQTPGFRALCEERLPVPSLKVKRSDGGYRVDRQRSFRELTGMGADLLRHGKQHILGITRAEMTAAVEIKMARLESEKDGMECLSPQVVVTVEYQPINVFIGREFPPQSCTYREILQHEMRHVRAYRYHLPVVEASIRGKLARRFGSRIFYGRLGEMEGRLKADISDNWLPLIDAEIRKVDATQAQIDSPEEYNRMERVCDGEVQEFISSAE